MDTKTKPTAIETIHSQLDLNVVTRGRVVFIGLGGVGMYVCQTAATFLAGLQMAMPVKETNLLLCDGDEFSFSNTYRMDVPEFGNKAEVLGRGMLQRFGTTAGFSVRWRPEYVTPENIAEIIQEGDCVLLAVDNHATRKLVGRYARALKNVVVISGGNDGVDDDSRGTYGNVQVHVRENGVDLTAPLDSFHPEIQNPADKSPSEMDCLELEAAGIPQISLVNMAVASAMLNALLRLLQPVAGERMYDELSLDILEGVNQPQWISGPKPMAACPRCGKPFSHLNDGDKIPTHDFPPMCRQVCPGSGWQFLVVGE